MKSINPIIIKSQIRKAAAWNPAKPVPAFLYKWFKRLFVSLAAVVIIFFLLNWFSPLPDHIEYSTIVTDSKGEVVHAFLTNDEKWRMKTELEEISPLLRKTIIEKEDKYF